MDHTTIEALQADRARMDWLENGGTLLQRHDMSNLQCGARCEAPRHIFWAMTYREAIDMAIDKTAAAKTERMSNELL